MSDLVSLEPSEANPIPDDIVEFKDGGFQWRVKKVLAPNVYLRSVSGNRFAVYPISNIRLIWRDSNSKARVDVIEYYEGLTLA